MKRIVMAAAACVLAVAVLAPAVGARSTRRTHKADRTASAWDKQWLKTSLQGDLFEIRGGKLAEHKSHNKAVLRLAATLVRDHTKSFEDGSKLARSLGVEVPKDPTPSQEWELDIVSRLTSRFDHWYAKLEVMDHRQDIQEATDEVKDGTNSEVRDSARQELPVLHKHLRLAEAALAASPG